MRDKIKQKRFQVWLDDVELNFMYNYARQNHLSGAELIRGWIHKVMKREGFNIKEPLNPESRRRF